MTWKNAGYRGVRYREHPLRKHGKKTDRYFVLRYKIEGKRYEESLGWASEGWTLEKAVIELTKLKQSHKTAEGPQTLKEKRAYENARRKEDEEIKINLEKEGITFKQYFNDTYKPIAKRNKKDKTFKAEEMHFNLWIEPIIGNKSFKDIKPFDIERIKKKLFDVRRSPRTVQYVLATVSQVWNMARRDGIVNNDSPTRSVKIPKIDNKRQRFLTIEEEMRLLDFLKDIQIKTKNPSKIVEIPKIDKRKHLELYCITLLSLRTGMRVSEIFNLKWNCVDTGNGRITIMDAKGNKSRTAFMTEDIKSMLDELEKTKPTDYVFKNKDGGKHGEVSNVFAKKVQELKLNDDTTDRRQQVCFHTCRHTFASRLAESGVDLYTIKTLLGHSTIALTERYSHLSDGTLQNAIKVLDDNNKKSMIR
jgi:integrase